MREEEKTMMELTEKCMRLSDEEYQKLKNEFMAGISIESREGAEGVFKWIEKRR